jgi:hypothetical protein
MVARRSRFTGGRIWKPLLEKGYWVATFQKPYLTSAPTSVGRPGIAGMLGDASIMFTNGARMHGVKLKKLNTVNSLTVQVHLLQILPF